MLILDVFEWMMRYGVTIEAADDAKSSVKYTHSDESATSLVMPAIIVKDLP